MVYMVMQDSVHNLVKIGFTNDLERRMNEYYCHNPLALLVDVVEGTRKDETDFHQRMLEMGFEWIYAPTGKRTDFMRAPRNISAKSIRIKGFQIFS